MKFVEKYSLSNLNALKVNEKAKFYCELTKENELVDILEFSKINNLPIILIGEGTNIVPINSIEGLVVKNSLKGIKVIDEDTTEVASGENWHDFVKWTLLNNKFGLENLALIPGTVGAGPIQNIGAYGSEISNSIKEVLVFNVNSNDYEILTNEQCEFGYRTSVFKERSELLILSVTFTTNSHAKVNTAYQSLKDEISLQGLNDSSITPKKVFDLVVDVRKRVLPDHHVYPNVGSFFKNVFINKKDVDSLNLDAEIPTYDAGDSIKIPSAYLLEKLGWKGKRKGGVGMSAQHSLVLVSYEQVTGNEILSFANEVINDVNLKTNIQLEIEPTLL